MEQGRRVFQIELCIPKEEFEKEVSAYSTEKWSKVMHSSMGDNIFKFGGENFVATLAYTANDKYCLLEIIPKEGDFSSDMEYNEKLYNFLESVIMPYKEEHKNNINVYLLKNDKIL